MAASGAFRPTSTNAALLSQNFQRFDAHRASKRAKPQKISFHFKGYWCGREDSNFHVLSDTTTSTLRVYQFRHDRTCCPPAGPAAGRSARLAKRCGTGNAPIALAYGDDEKEASVPLTKRRTTRRSIPSTRGARARRRSCRSSRSRNRAAGRTGPADRPRTFAPASSPSPTIGANSR